MNARPILFSAPMVKALLAGTKTQTRRLVKPPRGFSPIENLKDTDPHLFSGHDTDPNSWGWPYADDGAPMVLNAWRNSLCPYGEPGDLLWVRETCGTGGYFPAPWAYRADGNEYPGERWTPAIHMPRRASRLTLSITDVRVQRLQDISEEDALAEGIDVGGMNAANCAAFRAGTHSRLLAFEYLRVWESINGPGSWKANPWVWALTFDVIKANVSEVKP